VVDGDRLIGFFDWDIAGPSSREFDLAFSVLPWLPLTSPSPDLEHLLERSAADVEALPDDFWQR
jgi:hypothetical protein